MSQRVTLANKSHITSFPPVTLQFLILAADMPLPGPFLTRGWVLGVWAKQCRNVVRISLLLFSNPLSMVMSENIFFPFGHNSRSKVLTWIKDPQWYGHQLSPWHSSSHSPLPAHQPSGLLDASLTCQQHSHLRQVHLLYRMSTDVAYSLIHSVLLNQHQSFSGHLIWEHVPAFSVTFLCYSSPVLNRIIPCSRSHTYFSFSQRLASPLE